jgi:hypothetical protein
MALEILPFLLLLLPLLHFRVKVDDQPTKSLTCRAILSSCRFGFFSFIGSRFWLGQFFFHFTCNNFPCSHIDIYSGDIGYDYQILK